MGRFIVAAVVACLLAGPARAEPLAVKYLYEGKLAAGEKALTARLADHPNDDQARLGLAAIQVFAAFERLGTDMHKYGLRTRSLFVAMPAEWKKLMPENPKPERLSYAAYRQMVQNLVDDAKRIDATLARIKDAKVKLPIQMGKVRIDLFGQGKMVSLAMFVQALGMPKEAKLIGQLPINFDYSDVAWLRGYCNFVAGAGETILALDTQPIFRTVAHRVFRNPTTMNAKQLAAYEKRVNAAPAGSTPEMSLAAFLHKVPVKEPARLKRALAHFESMTEHSLEMWKRILAEPAGDNQWIPNPSQTGAFGGPVTMEMVGIMQTTLSETRDLLKGTKVLAPPNPLGALGGQPPQAGINVRKMFTNPPKVLDVPAVLRGPGLVPYITPGTPSVLTSQAMIDRINRVFPGRQFFTFTARTN
jgi:hypothetical protein